MVPYEPKVLDSKTVFSNLESEGQRCGIIKVVTRLLLLGLFYTIQTNFMYYFAQTVVFMPKIKFKSGTNSTFMEKKKARTGLKYLQKTIL